MTNALTGPMALASPPGTVLWTKPVSPSMTAWATSLLNSPSAYPMFSTAIRRFGSDHLLARVEWHAWTYRNGIKVAGQFRGITLYEVLSPLATLPVEGIDISNYQKQIDWTKVAASKVFVFIKATEGTGLVDKSFASHWSGAKNAGLLRGAYHFFRPQLDAIAQADLFLSKVIASELPPVLDVEVLDNVAGARLVQRAIQWIDHVSANFRRPLVYASPSFWQALPSANIEPKADLWIAQWETNAPDRMGEWPGWSFWQYSSRGNVPGIAGGVDLNRFNGTMDDLHAYLTRSNDDGQPKPLPINLNTVLGVQQALNTLKIVEPPLVEDGVNGPKTRAAVRSFQRSHALVADGVVGEKTRAALANRLGQGGCR
jgi:lysozyme